jgi:RNA polymerase-interacting CarD/CdnL/TRCF family regulator
MEKEPNESLIDIAELVRRLERLENKRDLLLSEHSGNEEKYTYWAGYELGYTKGKIHEIEDFLDQYQEK